MITAEDLNNAYDNLSELEDQCVDEVYDLLGGEVNHDLRRVCFNGSILCVDASERLPLIGLAQIELRGFKFKRVATGIGIFDDSHIFCYRYMFELGDDG